MKLNFGCSNDIREGYINIDLYHKDPQVLIADASKLGFLPDGLVDEIIAKDILEHLPFNIAVAAVREWSRVLCPGGKIFIQTICFELQIQAFLNKVWDTEDFNYMLFAGVGWTDGISRDFDFHKSVFTLDYLRDLLSSVNIKVIRTELDKIDDQLLADKRSHNLNMRVWGEKLANYYRPKFSMTKTIDNRNIERRDFTSHNIGVGDLYKPWYYIKCNETGTQKDINNICLVYKIENTTKATQEVSTTSFIEDCRGTSRHKYFDNALKKSLLNVGQLDPVICVQQYSKNSPADITFIDKSTVDNLRIFEGHHRLITIETMGKPIKVKTYYLYDIKEPIDLEYHYYSIYDDSFWSDYQTSENKKPSFTLDHFRKPSTTMKYAYLMKCIDYLRNLGIDLVQGIDVGCAEGVYTLLASQELNIPMLGIDCETGRILRALLSRVFFQLNSVKYETMGWLSEKAMNTYKDYDFCLALSILHHVEDFESFLKALSENKKAMIIEARLKEYRQPINHASMIAFQSYDEFIRVAKRLEFDFKLIATGGPENDRYFFVFWK